jgi:hypothetical protein
MRGTDIDSPPTSLWNALAAQWMKPERTARAPSAEDDARTAAPCGKTGLPAAMMRDILIVSQPPPNRVLP